MKQTTKSKVSVRYLLTVMCLLFLSANSMAQTLWSEALWCESNSTLYFIQRMNSTVNPSSWNGLNVERINVSQGVDNTGTEKPLWVTKVGSKVKRVVFDTSFANAAPFSTAYWFYNMSNLEEIIGMNNLKTDRVTTMHAMFHGCTNLKGIDLSHFDTSNVTDMFGLFFNTGKLTSLNLSKFNTSKVTNMASMFSNTGVTDLDLSYFDTSNVTDMNAMFASFKGTTLDITPMKTDKVTNMASMFSGCRKITTLDLSTLNTEKVTNMNYMFLGDNALKTIYSDDTWTASTSTDMFDECESLKGAISYDASKVTVDYANPNTGYFTTKTLPIAINSKRIPRDQAEDLTAMSGVTVISGGYAKYDDKTNTLSLKDATISGWSPFASEVGGLVINLEGKNYFYTSSEESSEAMELNGATTITGGGYLYASGGGNGPGIQANASLTIDSATVEVYGKYGIRGSRVINARTGRISGSTLTLKGSRTKLIANSNDKWNDAGACVGNFRTVSLQDGIKIESPNGAKLSSNKDEVVDADDNTIIAKEVVITSPYTFYGITICGEKVTDWNCDDLTVIDGVDTNQDFGYAKYDPETDNLILNAVNIKPVKDDEFGISSVSNGLTITVKNGVTVTSNRVAALYTFADATINGGGLMMLASNSVNGATVYTGGKLTLDGAYVSITGSRNGLSGIIFIGSDGSETPKGSLVMKNYAVLGVSGTTASITGLTNFALYDGIKIKSPEGAAWNSKTLNVEKDGATCSGTIEIAVDEEMLDLWIAGYQVSTLKAPYLDLLLGTDIYKPLQNGKDYDISYDPKTKTLHMDNVSIATSTNAALISYIDGLTISVENNPCSLSTSNDNCNGATVYANTTIKAVDVTPVLSTLGFDLILTSSKLTGLEYYGNQSGTVTIDNTRIFASGGEYGISGRRYKDNYYATLTAKGKDTYIWASGTNGAIYNFNTLNMTDGLTIYIPENGVFDNHGVRAEGELATSVMIYSKGGVKGDVNQDGKVDISDIVAVINTIAGDTTYKSTANVNGDTSIDISDIVAIINIIAGQ